MDKLNSVLLAILASSSVFLASGLRDDSTSRKPAIAVVDYGAIIWRLDRIRVYSKSDEGMDIPEFADGQLQKLVATLSEIESIVGALMNEHQLSLVLRIDSLPDRQKGRVDFPAEKFFMPKNEYKKSEVNRLLRKRVVQHENLDLTNLVIDRLAEKRGWNK